MRLQSSHDLKIAVLTRKESVYTIWYNVFFSIATTVVIVIATFGPTRVTILTIILRPETEYITTVFALLNLK